MTDETVCAIALTCIPKLSGRQALELYKHMGNDATPLFAEDKDTLRERLSIFFHVYTLFLARCRACAPAGVHPAACRKKRNRGRQGRFYDNICIPCQFTFLITILGIPKTRQCSRASSRTMIGGNCGLTGLNFIQSSPMTYSTRFSVALSSS